MKIRSAVLGIAVTLICAPLLAGCGAKDRAGGAASAPPHSFPHEAVIDRDSAIVHFPSDSFARWDQEGDAILTAAYLGALAVCAQTKLNIPWRTDTPDPYSPTAHMWNAYGPWTKEVAEKFAFVRPKGDRALVTSGIVEAPEGYEAFPDLNEGISPSDREKVQVECAEDPQVRMFYDAMTVSPGPGQEALNAEVEGRKSDPQITEIISDLSQCYTREGMEMSEQHTGYPVTANLRQITEEQIQLALRSVACKEEVRFVERVSTAIAARQVPIIEEYYEDLAGAREQWEANVKSAKEFIAAHPDVYVQR